LVYRDEHDIWRGLETGVPSHMPPSFITHLRETLTEIETNGLFKQERVLATPQGSQVSTVDGKRVLNFCANNYLGLSNHPEIIAAAHAALDRWGYGLSSVRFICGTQEIHRLLETKLSEFLGTEDTLLYSSCFDANGGVFETLLAAEDAVISDELNHASIIDGIRLSKAQRYRYKNNDMADLEAKLVDATAAGARFKLIATDGVFSMDGTLANLEGICDLANKYEALVLVDDSHAVGFMGKTGRGSHEYCGVMGRIDLLTGTLGKALGGASGGYVSGKKEAIELLRQRSRPYLFSNSLAPAIAATTLAALDLITRSTQLRDRLEANTRLFRTGLTEAGLPLRPGNHPIIPVMLGDAAQSQRFARRMLDHGVYVVGFFHPVVPKGMARVRTQVSAAHTTGDLESAIAAFSATKREFGI
jgi:glycine C-acetyltransferase